jgi:hypothetical protein
LVQAFVIVKFQPAANAEGESSMSSSQSAHLRDAVSQRNQASPCFARD